MMPAEVSPVSLPRRSVLAVAVAASLVAVSAAQEVPRLRVVDLGGTPYERGLAHGEALREEIAEMLGRWRKDVARRGLDADAFVAKFLAATSYDEAARRWTPALLDEVRGIAAGAGQSFEEIYAYQLIDEVWAQAPRLFREKCTTIGVDRDGDRPALVAQNLDIPPWMHAFPTVLRIRHPDRDLESLVVTIPGLIGANGVNSRRVAVGVNTILQIRPCTDGLPVAFVVRGLLEQGSHGDALAFLRRVKHASGQAYTVGGVDRAPCFECSAGKVVRFVPFAGARWTFHTNHPLVNDDWSQGYLEQIARRGGRPGDPLRECRRFAELSERFGAGAEVDRALVVQVLSARSPGPICNPSTYVCSVMVLGEAPELRIAPGPPDETPFEVVSFTGAAAGR
jgi:hypothetical protein